MASSLAALGLCLFGSAAFAQYAGSPQSSRYQPSAAPPPVRSAYGTQYRPAVPPLPTATGTWRPNVAPAPIQEILEFEKEVPQAVPLPIAKPQAAAYPPAPVITPASYPQPVPIAVSGPAPIQTQELNTATPMPSVDKPVEPAPAVAPLALPEPLVVPQPQPEPAAELPPVVLPPTAPESQPAPSVELPAVAPAVIAESQPTPTVDLPAEAPPPVFPDSQSAPTAELPAIAPPAVPDTLAAPLPVAPLPQPWKPKEQPAPAAVVAPQPKTPEINLTALQPPGSAPPPMDTGRAPGFPDDGQGNYVQLDPPGPQRLFRLDSEMSLQERMRQEALSRPGQDKTEFPTYKPISDTVFAGRAWPCQTMLVEPSYVNYKPLMFQELNSERYGWDLGFIQPFVSTGYFIKDFVFWPYRRAADGSCCDSGAGYCLPGDPVPYLLYPPYVSVKGALAEAVVIAALVAIFP